jgi:hypothetical protein
MGLLAPFFLLAGLAVGVPLLIHLVQKERQDPTAFPSLMFLEATPVPFTARRHIRDPLLFALRALAIVALALAFARPVWAPTTRAAALDARRRDVVLLLDRSHSMRVGDRWREARAAADSVLASMGPADRLIVVPFDERAVAVTALTSDRALLRAGLDTLVPSDVSTRLAPAIAMAQQRLLASDAPRKLVAVISDLQRSAWDLTDDAAMPAATEVVVRAVGGSAPTTNRAVRSVVAKRELGATPARMVVSARLSNAGAAVRALPVRLEIGGRLVEERTVDLPAGGAAAVSFAPLAAPVSAVGARVHIGDDSLPGDNAFHLVLQPGTPLGVLVVDGRASPFVARALAIGDAPSFSVLSRTAATASAADLSTARVLVLPDGAFPSKIGAARLITHVEQGGGVVLALGEQLNTREWASSADRLFPGTVQQIVQRPPSRAAVLGSIDLQHPAFASVGDLTVTRFERYRAIDTTGGLLARFDDGSVAITEHRIGRGRVITIGSSLDGRWNDLPRQLAFLPLLHQLMRYSSDWRDTPLAFEAGATVRIADIGRTPQTAVSRWSVRAPSGRRSSVSVTGDAGALTLREAGLHELRPGGEPGARPLLVAGNVASSELDLATFEPLRLMQALLPKAGGAVAGAPTPRDERPADREARQSTWWFLLLGVTLLLMAESVVARRTAAPSSAGR